MLGQIFSSDLPLSAVGPDLAALGQRRKRKYWETLLGQKFQSEAASDQPSKYFSLCCLYLNLNLYLYSYLYL